MIKVGLMGYGKAGQRLHKSCATIHVSTCVGSPGAPFADVEILEQHFRDKPEISGTARKMADSLDIDNDRVTSLRLGGIVGHHEVIFGFPYQTLRIIHNSIERKAFGTGADFALTELAGCSKGFYTFDDQLMRKMRSQLAQA